MSTYELPLDALNQLGAPSQGFDVEGMRNALLGALEALKPQPLFLDRRTTKGKVLALRNALHGSIGEQSPPEPPALASQEAHDAIASDTPAHDGEQSPGAGAQEDNFDRWLVSDKSKQFRGLYVAFHPEAGVVACADSESELFRILPKTEIGLSAGIAYIP